MFYFIYTTEVFIFSQLIGITHANWWWIVWFILADTGTSAMVRANKLIYNTKKESNGQ
jgi:hypothetical protein